MLPFVVPNLQSLQSYISGIFLHTFLEQCNASFTSNGLYKRFSGINSGNDLKFGNTTSQPNAVDSNTVHDT
jgi:hypothetical protein